MPYNDRFPQVTSTGGVPPGLAELYQSGIGAAGNLLRGLPSVDAARTANAYFGIQSGMPGSEFVRNRGFDLYGQQAEQRQGRGLDALMGLLQTGAGNLFPTAGQTLQNLQFGQSIGLDQQRLGLEQARDLEARRQFDTGLAHQRAMQQGELGIRRGQLALDAAGTGLSALNSYLSFLS